MHSLTPIIHLIKEAFDATSTVLGSDNRRLEAMRTYLRKHADFGPSNNDAFERAFGAVAYTYLQDKVPNLLQYIVGFQTITEGEDEEKAAGVFVCKVGDMVLDVPMFFENNELKGHVIMRLRKPELFLPLREAFLDYVLSRMPQDLGESVPRQDLQSKVPSQPDMTSFDAAMQMGKLGKDMSMISPWAHKASLPQEYAKMAMNPETLQLGQEIASKSAATKIVNLAEILATSEELLKAAAEIADNDVSFNAVMAKLYGADWCKNAAEKLASMRKTAGFELDLNDTGCDLQLGMASGPSVVRYETVPPFASPEEETQALEEINKYGAYIWENGLVIQEPDVVSFEQGSNLVVPPSSGVYQVLMSNGDFRKAFVIRSSDLVGGAVRGGKDLVIDSSSKEACFAARTNYLAGSSTSDSFESKLEWNKLLGQVNDTPKPGDIGIFLCKNGTATGIVRLEENAEDADTFKLGYASTYDLSDDCRVEDFDGKRKGEDCAMLRVYDTASDSSIHVNQNILLVPKSAKFIRLAEEVTEPNTPCCAQVKKLYVAETGKMSFTDLMSVGRVKLRKESNDRVELNGVYMTAGKARDTLVFCAGLSKAAAESMIESAITTSRYVLVPPNSNINLVDLLKQANAAFDVPYVPFPDVNGNVMAGPTGNYQVATDQQGFGQAPLDPTRMPLQEGEDPHDYMNLGTGGAPMGSVGEEGIDEGLWDVAGLRAVIRNTRIDTDIRLVSKTLLSLIDRLGRQIFSFYAHQKEYAELYGENELGDLESLLLSNFEGCGDLFITLTRKAAEPNPELDVATLGADVQVDGL